MIPSSRDDDCRKFASWIARFPSPRYYYSSLGKAPGIPCGVTDEGTAGVGWIGRGSKP
jgi:hypothetical protein